MAAATAGAVIGVSAAAAAGAPAEHACPPKASCVGAAVEVEGAAAPGPRASVVLLLLLPAGHPEAALSLPAATLAPPLALASAAGAAAADAPGAALSPAASMLGATDPSAGASACRKARGARGHGKGCGAMAGPGSPGGLGGRRVGLGGRLAGLRCAKTWESWKAGSVGAAVSVEGAAAPGRARGSVVFCGALEVEGAAADAPEAARKSASYMLGTSCRASAKSKNTARAKDSCSGVCLHFGAALHHKLSSPCPAPFTEHPTSISTRDPNERRRSCGLWWNFTARPNLSYLDLSRALVSLWRCTIHTSGWLLAKHSMRWMLV